MYFSLDGWWGPTCEYMYRRFNMPMGLKWPAKRVNGYVYTAIVGRGADEEAATAPTTAGSCRPMPPTSSTGGRSATCPKVRTNFAYLDGFDAEHASLPELMIYLEEAIDIQERHFRLRWILNFAQFQCSMDFGGVVKDLLGNVSPEIMGKVNISRGDRNWDSLHELWKLKETVKTQKDLSLAFKEGGTPGEYPLPAPEEREGPAVPQGDPGLRQRVQATSRSTPTSTGSSSGSRTTPPSSARSRATSTPTTTTTRPTPPA